MVKCVRGDSCAGVGSNTPRGWQSKQKPLLSNTSLFADKDKAGTKRLFVDRDIVDIGAGTVNAQDLTKPL